MQKNIQKELHQNERDLERQIHKNEMEIKMATDKLNKMVKKGEPKSMTRVYAKNVLSLQKNHEKLLANKQKFVGVGHNVNNMFANQKMAENMGKVNNVMEKANNMVDIGKITKTSADMQKNLGKMEILDDMMGDAFGAMDEDDDYDVGVDDLINGVVDKQAAKNPVQGTRLKASPQQEDKVDAELQRMMAEMGM